MNQSRIYVNFIVSTFKEISVFKVILVVCNSKKKTLYEYLNFISCQILRYIYIIYTHICVCILSSYICNVLFLLIISLT